MTTTALQAAQAKIEHNDAPQESSVARWLAELMLSSGAHLAGIDHDIDKAHLTIALPSGTAYSVPRNSRAHHLSRQAEHDCKVLCLLLCM